MFHEDLFINWSIYQNVEPIEIVKIFGYIFVLLICYILLKGLSSFEFALRDQTVTYEKIWNADFSGPLDTLVWTTSEGGYRVEDEKLILSLSDSLAVARVRSYKKFDADTGYFQLKLKLPESELLKSRLKIIFEDRLDEIIPLDKLGEYQTLRSSLLGTNSLESLELSLSRVSGAIRDSSFHEMNSQGLIISNLSFYRQNRPQKVF